MYESEEIVDLDADRAGEEESSNGSLPPDEPADDPHVDPTGHVDENPDLVEDVQDPPDDIGSAMGDTEEISGHQGRGRIRHASASSKGSRATPRSPRRLNPSLLPELLTECQFQTFKKLRVASSSAEDLIEAYSGKTLVGARLTDLKSEIKEISRTLADCYEELVDLRIRELAPVLAKSGTFKRKLARLTASLEEREASITPPTPSVPIVSRPVATPAKNTEAMLSSSEHELQVYLERLSVNFLPNSTALEDAETLKMTVDVDLPQIRKYIEECKKSLTRYTSIPGANSKLISTAQRTRSSGLRP